uniref:Phenolphthiocerol/phthiocerol polyketide synthase subunit E n=1 Tax=Archangium disciforme TaxID=38 RepID=Q5ZPA8_9BACT|nr:TubD protein [Archangium disciforme]
MTPSGDEALQSSIALVGMAGRFPGAPDVESFWRNLVAGVESISFFSEEELRQAGVSEQIRRRPEYVPAKGVLEDLELFDAGFFGYSPREASHLDPQQRLLLECSWEALEDAGLRPDQLPGWVGVYVGAGDTSYRFQLLRGHGDPLSGSKDVAGFFGNYPDFLATRVAYKLNLRGPALGIHTACSTSLVSINMACSALRGFECDMALAGGVSLRLPARSGYLYEEGGVASKDGHCRPFDARATGTVTGDGVGVVVLKRLEDALKARDPIHAVIRGWALNNDGASRAGFTAPSVEGQSEVIALAHAAAGISARDITYVEAHGTGTPLGDPIEVAALTRAFRAHTADTAFCTLGAVKSNIGHLDAAAGVAGVIKTVQALRHRLIPPTLHFERPNPALHLEQSPFFVNTQPLPWESPRGPRLAGVSSFGIGGTNAHTLFEEAPPPPASGPTRPNQVLLLSARSTSALEHIAGRLAAHLRRHPDLELADVAFTLQVGRARFPYRRALTCRTLAEAMERLEAPEPRPPEPLAHEGERPPLVMLFPGQGTPLVGTARALHESEPTFRQAVEQCARLLRQTLGLDVREVLFPSAEQEEQARRLAAQTRVAQPALFTLEYALAQTWLGWGLQPQALAGHSLGELVAACLAGVFSLEDALQLVAARGQLMQGCPPGAMLAVPLPEAELAALLGSELCIAAVNGPRACVASGPLPAVEALTAALESRGVSSRRLETSHAFHSASMEACQGPLTTLLRRMRLQAPRLPCVSGLTGRWLTGEEATEPTYWARQLREPVRFSEALETLWSLKEPVLLEVGPGTTLTALARRHPTRPARTQEVASLPVQPDTAVPCIEEAVGELWQAGLELDWSALHAAPRHRAHLPPYPFERQRYWIEPEAAPQPRAQQPTPASLVPPEQPSREALEDWFYVPTWEQAPATSGGGQPLAGPVLAFMDSSGLAEQVLAALWPADSGALLTRVEPAGHYEQLSEHAFRLRPESEEDWDALFQALQSQGRLPRRILHAWALTAEPGPCTPDGEAVLEQGFFSLLRLARALGRHAPERPVQLEVLSSFVHAVGPREPLEPLKATLLGACAVLPLEYPHVQCRTIDVRPGSEPREVLVRSLAAELAAPMGESPVAWRDGQRYVRRATRQRLEASRPLRSLRERGVYLVAGGLGGIGLVLARALAQRARARLALLTHSPFPPREQWEQWLEEAPAHPEPAWRSEADPSERRRTQHRIRCLLELEQLGAEVQVYTADVAEEAAVRSVVEQVHARWGKIHGVLHAAATFDDGVIQLRTHEQSSRALRTKVRGSMVLHEVLASEGLDWFALCSSLASALGSFGQADYCAANAFQDAYAHHLRRQGFTGALALDWGTWRDTGAAMRLVARTRRGGHEKPPTPLTHPLFDCEQREPGGTHWLGLTLRGGEDWVVDEHRLQGVPTLPGVAYLELARAACAQALGAEAVELAELLLLEPLTVPRGESRQVRVVLQPEGQAHALRVESRSEEARGWNEHARGRVRAVPRLAERIQPELLRAACEHEQPVPGEPQEQGPVHAGARWHGLFQWVRRGPRQALAQLALPEPFHGDLERFELHPALMDMATSFAIPGGVPWLAFGYERVLIHGPLPPQVLSHVSLPEESQAGAQQLRLQVRLLDLEGWERVRIDGYLLRPLKPSDASVEPAAPNVEVAVGTPGLLESLGLRRCTRPAPGPRQVEIEVEAAGLNFLDVLGALGMMPALEAEESVLGRECSGRIAAVGEGVSGLRVGDEVLAVAPGCFRSYVLVDESQVVRRPASLGLAEGAAQMVPFATAYFALHTVGRLRRGERILIHAAAGGLGLAAVQLASRTGAEILATAGSEQKREYLRSLGIAHVLDSRSTSFVSEVRERTGGRGVDVVLNSLAGELLLAGLSVLAPHGRFLELGKRDLYADQQVGLRTLARGQTFAAIDFGPHHPDFRAVLEEVATQLTQGQLEPLPTRLFPARQVAEAFSFMARALHIGRVAVSMQGATALPASMTRGSRPAPVAVPPWEDPRLAGGISSEEGAEAFLRALEQGAPQLIISPQDFSSLLRGLGGSQGVREKERLVTGRAAAAEPQALPPSSLEQLIEQVWRKHLGVERVQPTDSFFQLGGDSLLGIQVAADLRRHLGVELPTATLFSHPTLAALAAALRARQGEAAAPTAPAPALVPDPAARFEPFPLTDVQEAYWVGRRSAFELGGVAAHGYFEIESPGLEVERFIQCWRQLLQRHDMLRMVVLPDGRQQVLEQVPEYTPEVVELRGLSPQEAESRRLQLRERMAHQVLRSDRWPLFELVLCRYEGGVRIHMSMDALMLDAWSSAVLRQDFAQLYHEPGRPLEPLAITFRDYVLAERRLREGEAHERARAYWWARLDTLPPPPELPLVKEPSQLEHARFTHREARLEPHRWARLQERARAHGLTPSAACMAAFAEVLARWSRHPRFTLNLTLFQRLPLHPQVDELVGDFTSLVLLEVEAHAASTFAERASRLQAQLWRDLEHGSVSAVQLIRELVRTGRRSPGAIMPVVFTSILSLDARRGPQGSLSFFEGELVYSISQTPQVWLDHGVHEEEGALVLAWDSVEALFPPGMVDDMFHAYQRLLGALAEEEQAWEGELPELLPPAQRELLARYNATQAPRPSGRLEEGFFTQARLHPELPALLAPERTLSYGELARRAQALAARLRELEVQPQELVAIAMHKGWEQATAVLGVLQAAAAYLPLDPEQPPLRLHQLLEEGPARVVLTQSSLLHTVPWPPGVQVIAVDELEPATEAPPLPPRGTPEHLAYVIYTSGSTGKPKGVAIEHRAALNTVVDLNTRFGVGPEDRVLGLSALTFDLSVYDVLGLLGAGGALVLPAAEAEKDPAHWWERLVAGRVTVWNSTPALMLLLVEYAEQRGLKLPAALRLVMLSGDWIPVALPDRIRALGRDVQVVSLGGATEASIWSIAYPIGQVAPQWKSIPYGMPLANQRFHVLDGRLEARPWWVPGELYIGGEGLAREYWRDEPLTATRFIRHPRTGERLYRTGDQGRMLPEGSIEFLGREDLQVKVQGFRVELGEIEAALAQHPALSASVVVARGEPRGVRRLVAYAVPRSGQTPAAGELRRYLAERLPAYMVPSAFVLLESLPRSRNGKIARDQLPEPQQTQGLAAQAAAADPLVERLAALVKEALRLERVEPQDSLLDLGADSVALIRLINRLEAELQFRPRLADIYENPTVQGLATLHQEKTKSQGEGGAPRLTAPRSTLLPAEEWGRFKANRPGLRRFPDGTPEVALPGSGLAPAPEELTALERRRSVRTYSLEPVSHEQLGRLLAPLREWEVQGSRRYLYASAGGLYPVQLYLHLKPGRARGLEPGTWYYDPSTHRLVLLSAGAGLDRRIHDPHQNQAIFDSAAFSLFLIARMGAVEPVYAEHALHFATLEAGLMTQLLDLGAAPSGLGLCHIGDLDFAQARGLFHLEEEHVLLHSLVGGVLPTRGQEAASVPAEGGTEARQLAQLLQQVKTLTPEAARALLEARRGSKGRPHE